MKIALSFTLKITIIVITIFTITQINTMSIPNPPEKMNKANLMNTELCQNPLFQLLVHTVRTANEKRVTNAVNTTNETEDLPSALSITNPYIGVIDTLVIERAFYTNYFSFLREEINNHQFNSNSPFMLHTYCQYFDESTLSQAVRTAINQIHNSKKIMQSKNIDNRTDSNAIDYCSSWKMTGGPNCILVTSRFFNKQALLEILVTFKKAHDQAQWERFKKSLRK